MTIRGQPIEDDPPYRNPKLLVSPGVSYNMSYAEWEAAIACGATLAELMAWDDGHTFPARFKAKVLAFHQLSQRIASYVEDARVPKTKRK